MMDKEQDAVLESLEAQLEQAESKYREAVEWKQRIQQEFADMNVLVNGRRANEMEYNAWKQRKLREARNIEREIAHRKQVRFDINQAIYKAKRQIKLASAESGAGGALMLKDQEIANLKHENFILKSANADLERQLTTMTRQYDALIRQHNAIPRTVRNIAEVAP